MTALESANEFRPEIILCDIGLPDLDGYAVARAIRANGDLSGIFLVAVTGYGQDADRQLATEAGFDRHITKPIGIDSLRDLIEQFERSRKCAHNDNVELHGILCDYCCNLFNADFAA